MKFFILLCSFTLFATPSEIAELMNPLIVDKIINPIKKGKIRAAMDGEVVALKNNRLTLRHRYLENHHIKLIETTSCLKTLNQRYQTGERIDAGTPLGAGDSVQIDHRNCSKKHPRKEWQKLLKLNETLLKPVSAKQIIIAIKHQYKLYIYRSGELFKTYPIALSQQPVGKKEKRGDLKLPEGQYKICQKAKGPFGTKPWWVIYLGPRYLRISYPNRFDAANGLKKGIINKKQYNDFIKKERRLKIPPKHTPLGGGILIHGWHGEWALDQNRDLTWGCISMRNRELIEFHKLIQNGTPIIILP